VDETSVAVVFGDELAERQSGETERKILHRKILTVLEDKGFQGCHLHLIA